MVRLSKLEKEKKEKNLRKFILLLGNVFIKKEGCLDEKEK